MVMEAVLFPCENGRIDISSDRNLFDLEYADAFVLVSEDPTVKIQFSSRLSER